MDPQGRDPSGPRWAKSPAATKGPGVRLGDFSNLLKGYFGCGDPSPLVSPSKTNAIQANTSSSVSTPPLDIPEHNDSLSADPASSRTAQSPIGIPPSPNSLIPSPFFTPASAFEPAPRGAANETSILDNGNARNISYHAEISFESAVVTAPEETFETASENEVESPVRHEDIAGQERRGNSAHRIIEHVPTRDAQTLNADDGSAPVNNKTTNVTPSLPRLGANIIKVSAPVILSTGPTTLTSFYPLVSKPKEDLSETGSTQRRNRGRGGCVTQPDFNVLVACQFAKHDDNLLYLRRAVHVFIDWSNISIGFWNTLSQQRRSRGWERNRIDVRRLTQVLERGRNVAVRKIAGSRCRDGRYPVEIQEMQASLHYDACFPTRIQDPVSGRWREQMVDEGLHLRMAESMIAAAREPPPGIMVVATGDANAAEFSDGFLAKVVDALDLGWTVEVHAFRCSMASAWCDPSFCRRWEGRYSFHCLDAFAEGLAA